MSDRIGGFTVTTRFRPQGAKQFMGEGLARQPGRLKVSESSAEIPGELHNTPPDRCCEVLEAKPTRRTLEEMDTACRVAGLWCTEGRTRTDYREIEERGEGSIKLNPILDPPLVRAQGAAVLGTESSSRESVARR